MDNPIARIIRGGRKSARLTPDGLPITEFPAPVVRLLRLYGLAGSYQHMYATQPNVRTIVDDLSREAAELSLKMYMKDSRGPLLSDVRVEVSHPLIELLSEPQPGMSPYRLWKAVFADKAIFDIAYWRLVGNPPTAIVRIPPDNINPQIDPKTGAVTEYVAFNGQRIRPEEMVVFWGYDPSVNHGNIPPIETLRRILAEDYASSQDREHRWSNALRKDGVIEQDVAATPMSDEALQSFLTDVEDALAGPQNTATPLVLQPGMRWKDVEWSPKEMEYLNARKLNRVEVAAAYHYPANKVLAGTGDPTSETLAYFYQSTLPPYLSSVEAEIEAQLLPKFELLRSTRKMFYVEFNLDSKLRGSFEQQASIMATTAGGPVVLVNEARARLNLPPIEGGDKIFVPMNSMQGGGPQVSPQNPIDTPAQGLNPVGTTPTPLPGGGGAPALPSGAASINAPQQIKELLSPAATDDTIETILAKHDQKIAGAVVAATILSFLREARARFEERHAKVFENHFKRQRNSGKREYDSDRWNRELSDDLFGVLLQTVELVGSRVATHLEGDWSTERTNEYLRESAEANAQAINEATAEMAAEVEADLDAIFSEDRARELAVSRTTNAMNWATGEAVYQNELDSTAKKTWHVTSRNPRKSHAELNEVTVGFDEPFPNGLRFPGDGSAGNTDEVANCQCVMTVSVE